MRDMALSRTVTSLRLSSPDPPEVDPATEGVDVVDATPNLDAAVAPGAGDEERRPIGGGPGLLLGVMGDGVRLPPASDSEDSPPDEPPILLRARMQKLHSEVRVP